MITLAVVAVTGVWALSVQAHSSPTPDARPALSVYITGADEVAPNEECAWQAIASGGTPPYSYSWWGALTGSNSIVFGSLAASSYLWVEVTDSNSDTDSDDFFITVDESAECLW